MAFLDEGLNLPQIFMAAQQVREARQRQKLLEEEQQRRAQLPEALAGALGDVSPQVRSLLELDPNLGMKVHQQQQAAVQQARKQEQLQLAYREAEAGNIAPLRQTVGIEEANKFEKGLREQKDFQNKQLADRAERTAKALTGALAIAKQDPGQLQSVAGELDELVKAGAIDGDMVEEAITLAGAGQDPTAVIDRANAVAGIYNTDKGPAEWQLFLREKGLPPDTQSNAQLGREFSIRRSQLAKERAVNINTGDFSKSVRDQITKEALHLEKVEDTLSEIESLGDPTRFLSAEGGFRDWWYGVKDWAWPKATTPEEAKFMEDALVLRENVELMFQKNKHMLTGAQAGEKEMAKIEKAMLNTKLSPAQFKASFDKLKRVTRRNLRIAKQLLETGRFREEDIGTERFGLAMAKEIRKEREREKIDTNKLRFNTGLSNEELEDPVLRKLAEEEQRRRQGG